MSIRQNADGQLVLLEAGFVRSFYWPIPTEFEEGARNPHLVYKDQMANVAIIKRPDAVS